MTHDLTAFITDEMGAAFISGEQAAILVQCPREDLDHESAWWLGFLNGLLRKGVPAKLRHGGATLVLHRLEGQP
jgi:hypothetical protein